MHVSSTIFAPNLKLNKFKATLFKMLTLYSKKSNINSNIQNKLNTLWTKKLKKTKDKLNKKRVFTILLSLFLGNQQLWDHFKDKTRQDKTRQDHCKENTCCSLSVKENQNENQKT